MKYYFSLISTTLIVIGIFAPIAHAQTTGRYNPNVQIQSSGSTFQGVRFSGVGSAIAGCANLGGLLSKGINAVGNELGGLFKKSSRGGSGVNADSIGELAGLHQEVPTTDKKNTEEQKKANQIAQCLNGVAYAVSRNVLQQVTNKTLAWINTGFDGNPLYIRNIDSYLRSIRDEKVNDFLGKISYQDPVFGTAIRSVITQNITGKTDGLLNKAMNTPEGRAYEAFQQDFTQGGWRMLLDPAYNPVGAALDAGDKLAQDIDQTNQTVQNELDRNGGFLDMKKCVEYAPTLYESECEGQLPGERPSWCESSSAESLGDRQCLTYETVTPGSVISAQINEVTTSPVRQLEQADQINEVFGAFFDQLLNRLFANGLASLSRKGQGSGTGIGSNVVIGNSGQTLGSYTDTQNALGFQASTDGFTQDFDISRPQQIRAITKTQLDYLNRARDARSMMNRVVPTLGALDYCFPGPNPTWTDGLDENYLAFYNGLETPDKTRSGFRNFLTTLPIIGSLFGGGSTTIDNALIGQPILTDKITGNSVVLDPLEFVSTRRQATHADFKVYFDASYGQTTEAYRTNFDPNAIAQAFIDLASTPTDQSYARGFVINTLKESRNLIAYDNTIAEYNLAYDEQISNVQDALDELLAIEQEATAIVATAKARYIAEQAAAGTPVNQSCIDTAYVINTTPIVGAPRLESDTPLPIVEQSTTARTYFYNTL